MVGSKEVKKELFDNIVSQYISELANQLKSWDAKP
jgi:hypothetical protein